MATLKLRGETACLDETPAQPRHQIGRSVAIHCRRGSRWRTGGDDDQLRASNQRLPEALRPDLALLRVFRCRGCTGTARAFSRGMAATQTLSVQPKRAGWCRPQRGGIGSPCRLNRKVGVRRHSVAVFDVPLASRPRSAAGPRSRVGATNSSSADRAGDPACRRMEHRQRSLEKGVDVFDSNPAVLLPFPRHPRTPIGYRLAGPRGHRLNSLKPPSRRCLRELPAASA